REILGEIATGRDPAAVRDTLRRRPTVADLCERYLAEYASQHKKASSCKTDAANIRHHLLPLLGRLNVAEVSRADIDRLKRLVREGKTAADFRTGPRGRARVRGGSGAANRCLALLSKMFGLAEQWGWRPDASNPCRHIARYAERKVERFLSTQELGRLGEVLRARAATVPSAVAAIRLLLFTGARLEEVLGLRWDAVDLERSLLRLADSKTGAKVIYLSAPAKQVLAGIPRLQGNPYVIAGALAGRPLVNLEKTWRRIREASGLPGVRLHDLRHSFASAAAAGGQSLLVIGRLLGHRSSLTTERYAHLAADPIRHANDATAEHIAGALQPRKAESITPIRRPRTQST
ncbi:MAG: site-specific integrase, partial [Actinobacteria bacterium]|nr:site-specific integrase [Actinomycetota bacterium]